MLIKGCMAVLHCVVALARIVDAQTWDTYATWCVLILILSGTGLDPAESRSVSDALCNDLVRSTKMKLERVC